MKFFIDNNLPIHLARALAALCVPEGYPVTHLKEKFEPDIKDVDFITQLSKEGNWVIITQDRMKKSPEREALRRSNIPTYILWG